MSGLQKNVIKDLFIGYITVSLLWRHQWYMYTELICSLNIEPLFVRCHPLNTFFKSRTFTFTPHNVKKPIHINNVPQNKRGIYRAMMIYMLECISESSPKGITPVIDQ